MCKFQQPQIPANVTADERRAIYFDALYSLDLRDKVEKYNDLTYLSWANAWAEFKRCYPSATYRIIKNPETDHQESGKQPSLLCRPFNRDYGLHGSKCRRNHP